MSYCGVGWLQLSNMHGIVLVVVSAAEPNCKYPSPISRRAEQQSFNTYDTAKLCK